MTNPLMITVCTHEPWFGEKWANVAASDKNEAVRLEASRVMLNLAMQISRDDKPVYMCRDDQKRLLGIAARLDAVSSEQLLEFCKEGR